MEAPENWVFQFVEWGWVVTISYLYEAWTEQGWSLFYYANRVLIETGFEEHLRVQANMQRSKTI